MTPPCEICKETVGEEKPAVLLAAVNMSFGAAKMTKWLPVCAGHYNGGQAMILTPVPELFLNRKDELRK